MDTKVSLRRTRLPRHSVKCVICWWTSSFGRPLFFFSHWLFCPSVGISFFFFFLNLRYLKGYPHRLCRCSHNFFQQTWFPEENGIMKKFSLSTTLGHGWCQNQWFTLFPLPSKAINGQRSVRLRRYKTACCSRLSRPQAGIALVVPESALTFIWANLLPSIQVLPSFPACSLLKEEYPISFPMNLQKNETNLFLLNEFSEEEGSFSCLCDAAQFSKDPGWYSVLLQPVPVQTTCVHTRLRGRGHCIAAQCYTVMLWLLPLAMGNAVGAGMTQLPFTGNMLRMLKKIKNSRSWSEIWPMPLNPPQPL